MNPALNQQVTDRLLRDYHFTQRTPWLQKGRCPSCDKKELFTHAEAPWVLRCGRLNHCGWEAHIKEVYPDLFDRWSARFPVMPTQPHAAADAYLRDARGFDLDRISGWYRQETYYDATLQIGSATVRFAVGTTFWERLIDQPERFGRQKARFQPGGSYAGQWWCPPDICWQHVEELWLVEGIFDAIALRHHGIAAVALLSCGNYPEHALSALWEKNCRPRLIWALDSDPSGQKGILKGVRRAREAGWTCDAAQIPQPANGKRDWNDLHQRERLNDKDIQAYRYYGALLLADSALNKARLIYQYRGTREFPFDYEKCLFWFRLDQARFEQALKTGKSAQAALESAATVTEIANCWPRALYYQANRLTDEAWYYFRVDFPNGKTIKNTFTGSQIACASEFKKRLLAMAPGAFYTGNGTQLDRYLKNQMANIRSVQTVDFIGYSREHEAYVFNDIAVKQGQVYRLNTEDFFEFGALSIKTLNQSITLTLNADLETSTFDWLDAFWHGFGAKGIVALAFWLGSLFAEQIRAVHKSFPFLEIVGEPGAGKSTLIEFLWKLLGRRDYEGFDPSKSSLAARARNFAQIANLPVVLIEGDRHDESRYRTFDWDELKTAYNGRSLRATGIKNGGNDTREPPFRGALVISQNTPVAASEAVLRRLIHLQVDRAAHTPHTKQMAEALERRPLESVSGFMLAAITREATLLKIVSERMPQYEHELQARPDIYSMRIAKNHAQIMALIDALAQIVPLSDEQQAQTRAQLINMAIERQQAINADHPLVQAFWECFDYLEGSGSTSQLNHSRDPKLIAVNLNHFAAVAAEQRQQMPALTELKPLLRNCRSRKFLGIKAVNSVLRSTQSPTLPLTVKCWMFRRG